MEFEFKLFILASCRFNARLHLVAQPPLANPLAQRPRGHPPRDVVRPLRPQLARHRPQQVAHAA